MTLVLRVDVPIASFRQSRAREYAETYPVPPPSTVYGMLLSLVGEMDRYSHQGTRLALGMLTEPELSTVIRTFRRFKKKELNEASNARPDYQQLLTGVAFVVAVEAGNDSASPTLVERLTASFASPESVLRFGGLSLGESRDLVDSVSPVTEQHLDRPVRWLVVDSDGILTLPIWVDHVGARGTRWCRYSLLDSGVVAEPPVLSWTEIRPSETALAG